jgi:hypothetical protein
MKEVSESQENTLGAFETSVSFDLHDVMANTINDGKPHKPSVLASRHNIVTENELNSAKNEVFEVRMKAVEVKPPGTL